MRVLLTFSLLLLCTTHVRGETLLEQTKMRGARSAQDFEDDPTSALPRIPWVTQTETLRSLAADLGITRVANGDLTSKEFGAGLLGQLHHSKLEQPEIPGMWGQSWALRLETGFGADGTHYFGRGAASANFGTMATLSAARHAFTLRFAADAAIFRDFNDGFSTGTVSIPIGFRFLLDNAAIELGGVPALGWASVLHDGQEYSTGPLFFGARAGFQTKAGTLELERLLAVTPADADQTKLSACGHYTHFILCAEGSWLRLHDISRGDEARFARVGINIGFGSWDVKSEPSKRKWTLPDVAMH